MFFGHLDTLFQTRLCQWEKTILRPLNTNFISDNISRTPLPDDGCEGAEGRAVRAADGASVLAARRPPGTRRQ